MCFKSNLVDKKKPERDDAAEDERKERKKQHPKDFRFEIEFEKFHRTFIPFFADFSKLSNFTKKIFKTSETDCRNRAKVIITIPQSVFIIRKIKAKRETFR